MLIKDAYLGSDIKNRSFSAHYPRTVGQFPIFDKQNKSKEHHLGQPYKDSGYNLQVKNRIQSYEREIRTLSQAYKGQEQVLRKVSNYQTINQQYHQAMKQRNYQLNTKINDLAYGKSLLARKHEQQLLRNTYDNDTILKKYQEQNQQILRVKRTNSEMIQQKARLQSQIDHLMFLMEKDNQQGSLQIKQQLIRMENMERTLRGILDTKDQQIIQLRHRLKVYQDENRRLNDLNKTLTIIRQQKIDSLSNISHLDSNAKSHNKQNIDTNRRDDLLISELNQQKQINQQLITQMNMIKNKLFQEPHQNTNKKQQQSIQKNKATKQHVMAQIIRLNQVRNNLKQKIFKTYCSSIKQGQRQKKNTLIIFIQNYKKSHFQKNLNEINQYMRLRDQIKAVHKQNKDNQLKLKIQIQLPMKINSRQHSKDSQWVLSTMQFTKNQRNQSLNEKESQNPGNNAILYLFRLITIKYRTQNSLQGKEYQMQQDVNNQLLHSIVKAVQSLIQIS